MAKLIRYLVLLQVATTLWVSEASAFEWVTPNAYSAGHNDMSSSDCWKNDHERYATKGCGYTPPTEGSANFPNSGGGGLPTTGANTIIFRPERSRAGSFEGAGNRTRNLDLGGMKIEDDREANKCPAVGLNDIDPIYDSVLNRKKDAIEEGKKQLIHIRDELNSYSDEIGKTGDNKELEVAVKMIIVETRELVKTLKKAYEKLEKFKPTDLIGYSKDAYNIANELINGDANDIVDRMPTFVPGIKIARQMKQWDAAKREISDQLDKINRAIEGLDRKLAALGGPNRAHTIEEILRRAEARQRQCLAKIDKGEKDQGPTLRQP